MVAFKEDSGGAIPYQKLKVSTSTSIFKSDQWSLLKKEVEVANSSLADNRSGAARPALLVSRTIAMPVNLFHNHTPHTQPFFWIHQIFRWVNVMNKKLLKEKWSYMTSFFFFKKF